MMILYMEVTHDEYELPLVVADSMGELARMRGVGVDAISKGVKRSTSRWKKVRVDDLWPTDLMTEEERWEHHVKLNELRRKAGLPTVKFMGDANAIPRTEVGGK